ncbi:MAG TPA: efflux RND transporter periplasmic adaptor subunit, partial [Burkholderiales bacterium]|nr:efflux RND transporter periplasmic adaptor subunit [Burkholderiales bacterium]
VDFQIQSRADQAEIARLTSLLQQQERVVERQQKLVGQGFITQNAADDAIAQRNALREQLNTAKARSEATGRSVTKARVVAPIDGEIETQIIAVGDYVKLGDPLFKLVGVQELRAHLFLPESAATRIRPGLKVVLAPPAAPEKVVESVIAEIKPTVGTSNRALDAIVKFRGEGNLFRGGGTVNARIVTQMREGALMVPEQSVVLRPAGKVVYALREGVAEQRIVETGLRQDGQYEILKGVRAGDTVAVDGAGFLTNGAAVTLPKPRPEGKKG